MLRPPQCHHLFKMIASFRDAQDSSAVWSTSQLASVGPDQDRHDVSCLSPTWERQRIQSLLQEAMAKPAAKVRRQARPSSARVKKKTKPRKKVAVLAAPAESAATLTQLIEDLGTGLLKLISAPKGLDVRVTEPIIHDAALGSPIEAGDIVLGVGVRADDRAAVALIKQAGTRRASAVVLKGDDVSDLTETAEASGVALIAIQPEMTWNQAHSLLRSTIASAGPMPTTGVGGVPVGDLFALANAVAAMVGGPTTIEDPQSRVLAFSSLDEPIDEPRREAILGRQVPAPWMKRLHEEGVFRKLWSSTDVVKVELPDPGLRRRLAIAVRAGGEILGSIWVQEGRKRLGSAAEAALREAARVSALHLIRHRASEDLDRQVRGELVRGLLEGQGPIEHAASRLGIEPKSSFTVMAFEIQSSEEAEIAVQRERALDLVSIHCEALGRRVSCIAVDRTIYALVPTPDSLKLSRLLSLARTIIDRAEGALRTKLRAGIGSTVASLRDTPRSRWEADQVLRSLANNSTGTVVSDIHDMRAHTILVELQDLAAERPHLKFGKVQVLIEQDRKRGTAYVHTLRAFLDNFGDITGAASAINVHPNTFRYRVRRLVELSAIDLNDPVERLVTELQLRLI